MLINLTVAVKFAYICITSRWVIPHRMPDYRIQIRCDFQSLQISDSLFIVLQCVNCLKIFFEKVNPLRHWYWILLYLNHSKKKKKYCILQTPTFGLGIAKFFCHNGWLFLYGKWSNTCWVYLAKCGRSIEGLFETVNHGGLLNVTGPHGIDT